MWLRFLFVSTSLSLFAAVGLAEEDSPFRFIKTNRILLDVGEKGQFDSCQAKYPSILKVGDRWWMWYNGRANDCFTGSIGLATSTDGLTWQKDNNGEPIFKHGPPGSFDSTKIDHPAVLHFDGKFHMWYTAGDDRSAYKVGYATSEDGIQWTRANDAKPVLRPGEKGKFDDRVVLHPAVVRDDKSTLHIWYNGVGPQGTFRVGHATSRDGINWERQNNGDPVLAPSQVGDFKEYYVYNVHVRFEGGTFHMWYSAAKEEYGSGGHNCLTYASSTDGTHWTKASAPTLLSGPPGSIDEYATFACYVVTRDDGLWMYYSAADKNKTYRVSLARQE
jgi:predicted GH43/DUF377 family glycosyl hydrolase